jgi:hypothetical protein
MGAAVTVTTQEARAAVETTVGRMLAIQALEGPIDNALALFHLQLGSLIDAAMLEWFSEGVRSARVAATAERGGHA